MIQPTVTPLQPICLVCARAFLPAPGQAYAQVVVEPAPSEAPASTQARPCICSTCLTSLCGAVAGQ